MAAKSKKTNRLGNIWEHDVAERLKIRRETIAKQTGVGDDYDVGTYPEVKEDTKIEVTQNGFGWKELLGVAALVAIPTAGWLYTANKAVPVAAKVIEKIIPGKTTIIENDKSVEVEVIPP